MDLILHMDNKLIQMSFIDAEREIEAICGEVIDVLKACSPTKQTDKYFKQYILDYLSNLLQGYTHCRDRECSEINSAGMGKKIL